MTRDDYPYPGRLDFKALPLESLQGATVSGRILHPDQSR